MKLLFLVPVFALVVMGAGCAPGSPSDNLGPSTTLPGTVTTTPSLPAATQLYRNVEYGFEFKYPESFGFATPNYAALENKIVQIQLKSGAYPGTNFRDAGIALSTVFAKSEAECLALPAGITQNGFKERQVINGLTFYTASGSEGAAGNVYESRYLRTYHNSQCFEIAETIHTTQVGNYPDGAVTEVDRAPIWNLLESIVSTFTFAS